MASTDANNARISPVNVLWQIEAEEELEFAGSTADPDALEFNTFDIDGTKVRWIFNLDGTSTIPTAGAGERVVEIAVVTGDSDSVRAGKAQTAIDGDSQYTASVSGTVVKMKRVSVGKVTDAADVDSGITIVTCRRGQNFDLGILEGDVELTVSPDLFQLTVHQTGTAVRAPLYQGAQVEVTTTTYETDTTQLKEIYSLYGGVFTPGAGTETFGIGTARIGANLLIDAARLVLDPVSSEDNLVKRNLVLAIPIPDTLTFSGENPRTLSITWQGYIDESYDSRINQLLFGDAFQAGLTV